MLTRAQVKVEVSEKLFDFFGLPKDGFGIHARCNQLMNYYKNTRVSCEIATAENFAVLRILFHQTVEEVALCSDLPVSAIEQFEQGVYPIADHFEEFIQLIEYYQIHVNQAFINGYMFCYLLGGFYDVPSMENLPRSVFHISNLYNTD